MKTLILYYTFGGATRKEAERLATESGASLCRVEEARDRSMLTAFIPGAWQARRRKAAAIKPLREDMNAYDRLILGCPVWGGFPAPAFNAMVEKLPKGKEVEVFLCSAGGETPQSQEGTKRLVESKGCKVISYRDIRTGETPRKQKA